MRLKKIISRSPIIITQYPSKGTIVIMTLTVIATWALAIISLCSSIDISKKTKAQIEEFKKFSIIHNRPCLHINRSNFEPGFIMRAVMGNGGIDGISPSEYDSISISITYDLEIINYGNTPLLFSPISMMVISKSQWENEYFESAFLIMDSLKTDLHIDFPKGFVDNILFPDSTYFVKEISSNLNIGKDDYKVNGDTIKLTIYDIFYIPYRDLYFETYGTFIMEYILLDIIFRNGIMQKYSYKIGVEKYIDDFQYVNILIRE
jgi:hypothetical protein